MCLSYEIVRFGNDAPPNVRVLAELHAQLLPRSPVVKLGRRFMEDFYYTVLPRANGIFGAVAYVDAKAAGFISLTDDSAGFMSAALRAHWPELARILALSLLSPRNVSGAWEAWRVMSTRGPAPTSATREAEILSIGVLPEFRERSFVRSTGIRIGNDLMTHGLGLLAPYHPRLIRAVVDSDNAVARMFYHGNGWTLERDEVPGWRTPSVEFVCRPQWDGDEAHRDGRAVG